MYFLMKRAIKVDGVHNTSYPLLTDTESQLDVDPSLFKFKEVRILLLV